MFRDPEVYKGLETTGRNLAAILFLLISKGICTEEEYERAKLIVVAEMDQLIAQRREEQEKD